MEFTKTQNKILQLLADGNRHLKRDLKEQAIKDVEATDNALEAQICYLRKKLRPIGQDIVCEFYQRRTYYRHVRLLRVTE